MRRLLVVVEGQTEEAFVKHLLAPHLANHGVSAQAIIVETSRDARTSEKRRGGGHWTSWQKDLRRVLPSRRDPEVRVTTMFDLYGLPEDFPELARLRAFADTKLRVAEAELLIARALDDDRRLIPYVQRHEFEALVLASLAELGELLDDQRDLDGLRELRAEVMHQAPEDVDDGVETAPSKRLQRRIPSYQKTVHGPLATEVCGLPKLRAACRRFDGWVSGLEKLGLSAE